MVSWFSIFNTTFISSCNLLVAQNWKRVNFHEVPILAKKLYKSVNLKKVCIHSEFAIHSKLTIGTESPLAETPFRPPTHLARATSADAHCNSGVAIIRQAPHADKSIKEAEPLVMLRQIAPLYYQGYRSCCERDGEGCDVVDSCLNIRRNGLYFNK